MCEILNLFILKIDLQGCLQHMSYVVFICELAVKSYKIYAAQIDALPSSNDKLQKIERTINVLETVSVVRSNVSWIDL